MVEAHGRILASGRPGRISDYDRAVPSPRLILVLSENWTMVAPHELPALVRMARDAEEAGFDGVMVSEHVVLGRGADSDGVPGNPREYALPGNQDPAMPWPSSLILLGAIASVTSQLRLIAGAVIPPLRHPLLIAKELATLDLLSAGRLVVQPTVSWHRAEYEALDVPFEVRGEMLDEHLAAWTAVWRASPASFEGRHYRFNDVFLEPKPHRPGGPALWFGGQTMHDRLLRRIVSMGSGFNPLGRPSQADLEKLAAAMAEAGRRMQELEMAGGTRAEFADASGTADLAHALASIPEQWEQGFTTFFVKPSQFTDDPAEVGPLCREVVERVTAMVA
jgi:probable F420-dependent oxidoreductase